MNFTTLTDRLYCYRMIAGLIFKQLWQGYKVEILVLIGIIILSAVVMSL